MAFFTRTYRMLGRSMAAVLIVCLLGMVAGWYVVTRTVNAAVLANITDTLSDSDLSASSAHTIRYTSTNAVTAGQTIKVQFDPTGNLFMLNETITSTNLIVEGATLVANSVDCGGGAGDEVYPTLDATAPDENITFVVCSGDTVAAGLKRIITATSVIANPGTSASYAIRIAGTQTDSGDTRVAIIDDVVLTAAVDTSLTFNIEGLYTATTNVVNGADLELDSTASTIPFGLLTVGAVNEKTIGQKLRVATNAANGFAVTVQQDGALRSANGSIIDNFAEGASTVGPIAWNSPDDIFGQPNTYGHIGVTSEDDATGGSDIWGSTPTPLFSGGFNVPRTVFDYSGPSNGVEYNSGWTNVAYQAEIGSLQEPATDYTMTLTYVVTPVF